MDQVSVWITGNLHLTFKFTAEQRYKLLPHYFCERLNVEPVERRLPQLQLILFSLHPLTFTAVRIKI